MTGAEWLLLPGAYLMGSIPFSLYLVRWATGTDVRTVGSGNPGATNALRAAGPRVGLLTLLCDVAKGILPVVGARLLGVSPLGLGLVAAAVVVGHVFSLFLGFRGGKGVATAAGSLGALAPLPMLLSIVVFLVAARATRYVSLGSVSAALSFPVLWWGLARMGWLRRPAAEVWWPAVAIALLIAVKHVANYTRIAAGRERRLGELRPGSERTMD